MVLQSLLQLGLGTVSISSFFYSFLPFVFWNIIKILTEKNMDFAFYIFKELISSVMLISDKVCVWLDYGLILIS